MKEVIKRDGRKEQFAKNKIEEALKKAFISVDGELNSNSIEKAKEIAEYISNIDGCFNVEEIQNIVEDKLMATKRKDVARAYIRYRYQRELAREKNTTDDTIFELLNNSNEYWNTENSNKNAYVVTTQRDYIAGVTCTDLTRRFLLDKDIVKAHDEGIIHFHRDIVA